MVWIEDSRYQGVAGQEEDSDEDFESYKKTRKSKGRMYHDAEDEEEWMVVDAVDEDEWMMKWWTDGTCMRRVMKRYDDYDSKRIVFGMLRLDS